MYLPLYNGFRRKYFIRIPVKNLCLFTVSLPLFAFIACVLITMYKDYENANHTHCNVPNIFPSISASIGNYEPQSTIWKSAIYIHTPLRLLLIYLRGKYYKSVIRDDFYIIIKIALLLNIMENISLVCLTHWTSLRHYSFHELSFKIFIGTSIFYMLFTCILLSKYRRRPNINSIEKYSVKLKWRTFFINVSSFALAAYFFLRHNRLCEPYVYSMFGFSEYIVVITNIIFHATTVYDLQMKCIYFSKQGIAIE